MLKITPQECLEDFIGDQYTDRNNKFLIPVYEKLFKDIGKKINITKDFRKRIKILKRYFLYIDGTISRNKINFNNKAINRREVIERLISLLNKNEIKKAINALEEIISFLCKNRTNINGLEIVSWSLFGKTTFQDIKDFYLEDIKNKENIKNALLGFEFISLLIEYKSFANLIINDLLMPVELKNPKRRQGLFDKEVFKLIATEIKKNISNFQFEFQIKEVNTRFLKSNTNWLITERSTKKIEFPLPKNAKKIDMLCKINDFLFIGTHKEQQADGGAQDNQAVDAGFLFNYSLDQLERIKEIFNINEIYLVIFLERGSKKITSVHWKHIFNKIKRKNNKNKYILSSVQFIDLIKSKINKK